MLALLEIEIQVSLPNRSLIRNFYILIDLNLREP